MSTSGSTSAGVKGAGGTGGAGAVPRCVLCGSPEHRVRDTLTGEQIVDTWYTVGVMLTDEGKACFANTPAIRHLECTKCGFQYFDPLLAGDTHFYSDLQTQFPEYYPRQCAAFQRAIEFAASKGLTEVLDIGCGAGYFLDAARAAGLKTSGLDLNAKAVAECRAKGHDVRLSTMAAFAKDHPGTRYKFVTAFEVVEHVPDPVEFVRDAADLVAPGGWLGISVPDNEGVHQMCELEPQQWPPHHLTRWRLQDLRRLGELAGVTPEDLGAEPRAGFHIRYFMELQGRLEEALGRRAKRPSPLWPELVCLGYRLILMKRWGPKKGLGLYGFFQKPAK